MCCVTIDFSTFLKSPIRTLQPVIFQNQSEMIDFFVPQIQFSQILRILPENDTIHLKETHLGA